VPRRKTLTARQRQVLDTIRDYIEAYGYPPTSREIGILTGCRVSVAQTHVNALARWGYVERDGRGARQLRILVRRPKPANERSVMAVLET